MAEAISVKNTKNEILDAYHEVLHALQETKKITKQEQKQSEEKKEVVMVASLQTVSAIVKNLAELKLVLVKSLEELESHLLAENKKLTTLQEAVAIQNKALEDSYGIKVGADTLTALLLAQKEKVAAFEKEQAERVQAFEEEVGQKRALWKKEQEEVESKRREFELQLKKAREREEEDYSYQRDLTRKKEEDQYETLRQALEKELTDKRSALEQAFAEREANLLAQEKELATLKEKVEKFPDALQRAMSETEAAVTERLTFTYDYEAKLAQKEVEGERKLYAQQVQALEAKVAQLESQAKQLLEKSNQANLQVQDIAVKAIEGASRQRYLTSAMEKPTESLAKGT